MFIFCVNGKFSKNGFSQKKDVQFFKNKNVKVSEKYKPMIKSKKNK